jgi:hypothetical protein
MLRGDAPTILQTLKKIRIKKGVLGGDLCNIYIERFQG